MARTGILCYALLTALIAAYSFIGCTPSSNQEVYSIDDETSDRTVQSELEPLHEIAPHSGGAASDSTYGVSPANEIRDRLISLGYLRENSSLHLDLTKFDSPELLRELEVLLPELTDSSQICHVQGMRASILSTLGRRDEAIDIVLNTWSKYTASTVCKADRYRLAAVLSDSGFYLESWCAEREWTTTASIAKSLLEARSGRHDEANQFTANEIAYARDPESLAALYTTEPTEVTEIERSFLEIARVFAYDFSMAPLSARAKLIEDLYRVLSIDAVQTLSVRDVHTLAALTLILCEEIRVAHIPKSIENATAKEVVELAGDRERSESLLALAQGVLLGEVASERSITESPSISRYLLLRWVQHTTLREDYFSFVVACQKFIEAFPKDRRAPSQLEQLALVYEEKLGDVPLAMQAYARILETYPRSDEGTRARVRIVMSYLESDQPELAYELLNEVASVPRSRGVFESELMYLRAQCESALGLYEERRSTIERLSEQYGTSPIASNARYWLACELVREQKYREALPLTKQIAEDYPSSEVGVAASRLVETIGQLVNSRGQDIESSDEF